MPKRIPKKTIARIVSLRKRGYSFSEIKRNIRVSYGSTYRYLKNVDILPQYRRIWEEKKKGSIQKMRKAQETARNKANKSITSLSMKEKLIFISALYWGEGSKSDFGLSNTDPELIKIFIKGLEKVFKVTKDQLRVSIRIYEDLHRDDCLKFWSKITGVSEKNFISVNVLKGKKKGKLEYGMCRVRVSKGGNLLKYIKAIDQRISELF